MKISTKLTSLVTAIFLIVGLVGVFAVSRFHDLSEASAEAEAINEAQTLASLITYRSPHIGSLPISSGLMLEQHRETLQEIVDFISKTQQRDFEILDIGRKTIADSDHGDIGKVENDPGKMVQKTIEDGLPRTFVEITSDGLRKRRLVVVALKTADQRIVGALSFEYTVLYDELVGLARKSLYAVVAMTVVGLGLAIGLGVLFSWTLSRPIGRLKAAAIDMANGKHGVTVDVDTRDEIGELANAFNTMTQALEQSRRSLEKELAERKRAEEEVRKINETLLQAQGELARAEEMRKVNEALLQVQNELVQAQDELVRKEKLSLLGQIAGSVGHELRNPLGVMSNAVYFLTCTLPENADETTKEYLGIIKEEIVAAERIVSDLLDSVRSKPPKPVEASVAKLIAQSLEKCSIPKRVMIELDVAESLPSVLVDLLHMQQVFKNLISNAVDAMPDGGTLKVRGDKDEEDGLLRISVQDTGTGIAPENMKNLFQPLVTTKARGIGLGLIVVKNLIEANGGRVCVESELGKGTTFTVTLPIVNTLYTADIRNAA